jgi:lysophospholipase L1-like esterase
MKDILILSLLVLLTEFSPNAPFRIFLIGDSTAADKPLIDNPEHGWGQMLPVFFTKNVTIHNHAKNGRSTRSFLFEGRWDAVVNELRPGDYVFIQFGHNDSKKEDTSRYADPHSDFKNNLLRFINDARSKNARPVLITPVNRRNFDRSGTFVDKHGDYPDVVRSVADRENVPLIDLHAKSKTLFERLGVEESKKLFLTSVPPNTYRSLPDGKDDNTHFTRFGALNISRLVVEGIQESGLPLKNEIVNTGIAALPGTGRVIGLDQYYNSEWKTEKESKRRRHHYTWDDTTNGGFSELARIFDRLGADTDTLLTAPTETSLDRFSVYIIVDPDTPKETDNPKYLQTAEIEAIERWVKNGGVLVLMGNDKGNSEFEHFNRLANRFGIHFNEDLHQDVRNNQYDSGKVSHFSDHPMFRNVRHVFIKQLSSLAVTPPGREILHSRGVTIMAESRFGAGTVFAVGDPWLYNEYIDNRRLPVGFENYHAAESFASWLCTVAFAKR